MARRYASRSASIISNIKFRDYMTGSTLVIVPGLAAVSLLGRRFHLKAAT